MVNQDISKAVLRISLALVFLYFGISQLISQDRWIGFIPDFVANIVNSEIMVVINGSLEVILGSLMLLGFFVRPVALILSLHLFIIAVSIGFSPTGVRDFGLSMSTLAVFLNGSDKYCLQERLGKKKNR